MIYSTKEILLDLQDKIVDKKPFSIIRLGDAGHGILSVFKCRGLIEVGKWNGSKGRKMANNILGQLTVPQDQREKIVNSVVSACNRADYIDSYEAFQYLPTVKTLGIIGRKCQEIYDCCGIYNDSFCNPFVHYFSIVEGELNLFDLMKGRNVFCITSRQKVLERLKVNSGARNINFYRIPRRGRKAQHYREHFKKVMKTIKRNASSYDLFLIGAGFLGKIYCDTVKRFGGRAFDAGRLFDFWSGVRRIDSRPQRFITYNSKKMLCVRKVKQRSELW